MGGDRYEKHRDPLTKVQKRELKHKEIKPDGEKRHLQIISYNNEKLVEMISDSNTPVFDKSIAKEEILRRLVKENRRQANYKSTNEKKKTNKKYKGWQKAQKQKQLEKKTPKTGFHIGSDHDVKYGEFIKNGGDPSSCPFD